MLGMIRFYSREEAVRVYRMPADIEAKVFPKLRPHGGMSGKAVYSDEEIDAEIRRVLRPQERAGRKISTDEYGEMAAQLKALDYSWSEAAKAVNQKYGTAFNDNSMRRCVSRFLDRQHLSGDG